MSDEKFYPIDPDFLDERYAITPDQVLACVKNHEMDANDNHGLIWKDYEAWYHGGVPDYAKEWYVGPNFYMDSGSFYQAYHERMNAMCTQAFNVRCTGFKGGRKFEWRCHVVVDGKTYEFYSATGIAGKVPDYWVSEEQYQTYYF